VCVQSCIQLKSE